MSYEPKFNTALAKSWPTIQYTRRYQFRLQLHHFFITFVNGDLAHATHRLDVGFGQGKLTHLTHEKDDPRNNGMRRIVVDPAHHKLNKNIIICLEENDEALRNWDTDNLFPMHKSKAFLDFYIFCGEIYQAKLTA